MELKEYLYTLGVKLIAFTVLIVSVISIYKITLLLAFTINSNSGLILSSFALISAIAGLYPVTLWVEKTLLKLFGYYQEDSIKSNIIREK